MKKFIIDTSVLLYHEDSIHAFPDNHLIIPMEVLEEIDSKKTRNDRIGNAARYVNRFLDDLRKIGSLSEGVKLGVSSRGIGSLKPTKEGFNVVGEDFMLATAADIVADPSAPDAFVEGIMEGKEWIWEGSILRERKAEEIKSKIDTLAGRKMLEEHKISLFDEFINSL